MQAKATFLVLLLLLFGGMKQKQKSAPPSQKQIPSVAVPQKSAPQNPAQPVIEQRGAPTKPQKADGPSEILVLTMFQALREFALSAPMPYYDDSLNAQRKDLADRSQYNPDVRQVLKEHIAAMRKVDAALLENKRFLDSFHKPISMAEVVARKKEIVHTYDEIVAAYGAMHNAVGNIYFLIQ